MQKILNHKYFFVLIRKTEDYKDRINIFLLKQDVEKKKEINDFFNRNMGLGPTIAFTDKKTVNKLIVKKGYIEDLRKHK